MSVFSPLSDEGDVVNDCAANTAVNSEDGRLSLTTQLLPRASSQVTAVCN